ncbi:methionyl-tRNA formyltransferase [Candidatus Parcubacteria bacterium]|nr:methionyl-tRNA formyltransferase [Candidatus Parcubacteria bacterium]
MSNKIKTIFIGTPDFALPGLKALISDPLFDVVAVITQPDKPVGRKQVLTPPVVKTEAEKHNILVHQPCKIKNYELQSAPWVRIKNLDLIVVIAYSQIIPKNILEVPKYGVINVHGSLLPKYRGAACIQWPIINGDKETGITIMKMDKGLDTGPILAQKSIPINATDTTGTLFDKISRLGAEILIPTLKDYIAGKIKPAPQNEAKANYVGQIKKADGQIDWNKPAIEIERFIRAMTPWPGAFAYAQAESRKQKAESRKIIKILAVSNKPLNINQYQPGEMFEYENGLAVQCDTDSLIIEKIQVAGKKPISGNDFVKGYNVKDVMLIRE